MNKLKETPAGELRQDVVTGKWVLVASGRSKKPNDFADEEQKGDREHYKADCPFCNLTEFPQEPDVLRLPDNDENWQLHVFANKFPALREGEEWKTWEVGPYRTVEAVGFHELLATRWHDQIEAKVPRETMNQIWEALILRYRELSGKAGVNYVQIIRNHGKQSGASLEHPHNQIFAIPVLPDDVADVLKGAERYWQNTGKNVFDEIVNFELEKGERVVAENEMFLAWCPYSSRVPFEVKIIPKKQNPYFEHLGAEERDQLSEVFQAVLLRLHVGLNDPAYNYYVHSAPCDEQGFVCETRSFEHFRWYIEITPRFNYFGGFEVGTGLEIVSAVPEESAKFLREIDVRDFD